MALNGDELARLQDALGGVLAWEPAPGETLDSYSGRIAQAVAGTVDEIARARVEAALNPDDEAIEDVVRIALDDHGHNGLDCRPEKPMDYTARHVLRALVDHSARQDDGERSGR